MRFALALSVALVAALAASPASADTPEAAQACSQHLTLDAPPPFGAVVACPGIRPGAFVAIKDVTTCTLNFVFRGTSQDAEGRPVDEGLFIGTAGHCLHAPEGSEQTWAPGQGVEAQDAAGRRFGEAAYVVVREASETSLTNLDFALFRVDDDREADVQPGLCHFGGPSGMSSAWTRGDVVHHFGNGHVYGQALQGRSGVVAYPREEASAITFAGAALPGDSGSPLIDADGRAIGVVTAILPPIIFATALDIQVKRAEDRLGFGLELVEAPFV